MLVNGPLTRTRLRRRKKMMGIWWRSARQSAALLHYCKRSYHISTPKNLLHRSRLVEQNTYISLPLLHPHSDAHISLFARSYAAPTHKNDLENRRLNSAITADTLRLVTEKGHRVVSRHEALSYAKKLKLDLVEVDGRSKPPVCKIMDYNKEKYKQEIKVKEMAKNKSESTIRSGDHREIRFKAKIEQKDLERKAEMAKQLMDRGYRVKCMVSGGEHQSLEEQLQRLLALIEDVSVVESGPRVQGQHAWLIAKHIKFGKAKKKGAQQTPKSVEIHKRETEMESKNEEDNQVMSPEEGFKQECRQSEEYAPFEQFKEFADEEVSNIHRVDEISTVTFPPSSEMKMHISHVQQQEGVVGDTKNYIKTETKLGDSNRNHDSLDKARQSLTNIHSILHAPYTSDIENQIPLDQSPKQSSQSTQAKITETIKVFSSLPLSDALNIGPVKQDHLLNSDAKQSALGNNLRHIFGRIDNDQGQNGSKFVKPESVDSVSEWSNDSIKANVKDMPDDHHFDVSTISEVRSDIVEEPQMSPPLNNSRSTRDQQKTAIGSSKISAQSLRESLVKRISGDRAQNASTPEKKPLADMLLKHGNESRWAILRKSKSSPFDGNNNTTTTCEVTSNVVPELQTSLANFNNDAATQEREKITIGSAKSSADALSQVVLDCSAGDQLKSALYTGKQPLGDILLKQANESQDRSSSFDAHNNTAAISEVTSNFVNELQTSPVNLINDAVTQDQPKADIRSVQISSDSLRQAFVNSSSIEQQNSASNVGSDVVEVLQMSPTPLNNSASTRDQQKTAIGSSKLSAQSLKEVLVKRSSGDQAKNASTTEKKPLADMLLKHASESRWAILRKSKSSHFDGNNNTTTTSEVTSNVVPEFQTSLDNFNNDAATQDREKITIGGAKSSADALSQVVFDCSAGDQLKSALYTGKQPLGDILLKQANESQDKPPSFDANNNTAATSEVTSNFVNELETSPVNLINRSVTQDQPKTDTKCVQISSDSLRQAFVNSSSSEQKNSTSNFPGNGIYSQGWSSTADANSSAPAQSENQVGNSKQPIFRLSEHDGHALTAVRSGPQSYSAPNEGTQKCQDSTPKQANNTGESTSSNYKEVPPLSVKTSINAMPRDSSRILGSKTMPWDDARQFPASDSHMGEGHHALVREEKAPTTSFSKQGPRWGIFSQPKTSIVENKKYPTTATENQSRKDCHIILHGPKIGASDKDQSDPAPLHLDIENQRQLPISSTITSKQDLKQTTNDVADKPRQKSWGIFSIKVPTKTPDGKEKPKVQ